MTYPLLAIAGPTGSGKSDLALRAAEEFGGEVVNCDSVQVYRHFDIGSAKLPLEARRGIPHHLIDVVEPDEPFTAGEYARLARTALREIASRNKLPVVVGGTGFYLTALLDGLFEGPSRNEELRAKLARKEAARPGALHKLLGRLDETAAARIHANDTNKLIRALEVIVSARKPLTEMFRSGRDPLTGFEVLMIGLNPRREPLYARIETRTKLMFERGLLEETKRILEMGYPKTAKPFESLGYAQAIGAIEGTLTIEQATAETQMQTRRYAKRQWTWFRREERMRWIEGFGDSPELQEIVLAQVKTFLAKF